MRVRSSFPLVAARPYRLAVIGAGVLLAVVWGSGCAPESPGSTSLSDTTATTAASMAPTPGEHSTEPSAPAPETNRTLEQRLSDARLQARLKQAFVHESSLRLFDLHPEAVSGRVTLRGDVNTLEQYRTAARVAEGVDGVEAVANELTVEGEPVAPETTTEQPSSSDLTEESTRYHTVQPGQTLWSIAQHYDTSVETLRALNNLPSPPLQPGQRIRVR